jgi:hypothetical protein
VVVFLVDIVSPFHIPQKITSTRVAYLWEMPVLSRLASGFRVLNGTGFLLTTDVCIEAMEQYFTTFFGVLPAFRLNAYQGPVPQE